jgi:hypothetical protein
VQLENLANLLVAGPLASLTTDALARFAGLGQRVRAGLNVVKEKLARDGKFTSKAGKVRRKLGRPGAEPEKIERALGELAKGIGIGKVAKTVGLGPAFSLSFCACFP